jgi:hypothetical protein
LISELNLISKLDHVLEIKLFTNIECGDLGIGKTLIRTAMNEVSNFEN